MRRSDPTGWLPPGNLGQEEGTRRWRIRHRRSRGELSEGEQRKQRNGRRRHRRRCFGSNHMKRGEGAYGFHVAATARVVHFGRSRLRRRGVRWVRVGTCRHRQSQRADKASSLRTGCTNLRKYRHRKPHQSGHDDKFAKATQRVHPHRITEASKSSTSIYRQTTPHRATAAIRR
jgi:hypothetical protein